MQLNIPFSLEGQQDITDLKDINDSFASGTLKIMYLGANRNGSSFTKEAVLKALPTLYNVPIVANYNRETDEIGGHDIDVVLKDGNWNLVNLTQPCGVIPEHADFHFDLLLDESGTFHEYLVADNVILWKRQEVYDALMSKYDGAISHSMEITANETSYDKENEIMNIDDFQFTALCLLGNASPCFEGSNLEITKEHMFSNKMNEMMKELKETLASMNKEVSFESNSDVTDINAKGGEDMDTEVKLVDEAAVVDAEDEVKVDKEFEEEELYDTVNDSNDEERATECLATFESMEGIVSENGKYWLLHASSVGEPPVYSMCLQSKENYRAYVVKAVQENGALVVDWDNAEEKAFTVVDVDAPNGHADLPGTEELMKVNGEFSAKVTEYETKLSELNVELDSLRSYKANIEDQKLIEARSELLNNFTDISETPEFKNLMEHLDEYDLDVLEEKLYAIRGRNVRKETFSNKQAIGVRLGVDKQPKTEGPYGSLFKKYKVDDE